MKIRSLLPLLALTLSSLSAFSQEQPTGFCGTHRHDLDAISEQLQANLADVDLQANFERSGAITYVPLRFYIVQKNDGTGGIALENVMDMLCGMNELYLEMDIQFYIKGNIVYLKNSTLYDDPMSSAGYQAMVNQRLKGFMNIFITKQTGEANVLAYYTSGWPSWESDLIVIRHSDVMKGTYTIEHEIGHYFTILHTFNGWECDPWEGAKHGIPLASEFAPCNSTKPPFNTVTAELADGSNSTTAGDFFTDTPADYNLGLGWANCSYSGGARDKNGVLLNPDEKNIMGYFTQCSDYYFSSQQKSSIQADLNARKNSNPANNRYLNTTLTPELQEVGEAAALFPVNGGASNGLSGVSLEWLAGPGAKSYIVRIDRFTSFKFQPKYYYVSSPEVVLDFNLNNNAKYYWQVYPYNEYNTCSGWGDIFSFTAGVATATQDIPGLESVAIESNPLPAGSELTLLLELMEDPGLSLEISDLTGRVLHQISELPLHAGEQRLATGWQPAHPGMYMVSLRSSKGIRTERLIVR